MDPTTAPADWNVVVTVAEEGFRDAVKMLAKWGRVKRTPYYNVLSLCVADPCSFLDIFAAAVAASPGILNFVSHVVPAQETFDFSTAAEFENRARAIALGWVSKLRGKSFHVRLHRRGLKGVLSTHREEQVLADALLAVLQGAGRVAFTDPDAIIQIETIDGRAGMSLRTRDDIRRFPFLGTE